MKNIVDFVLKNKLAVWLLTILLIFTGIYSGMKMKMESLPDITIPYMFVTTVYPGATPEQVDDEVSSLFERQVKELEDVKNVTTTSYQNISTVQIEYNYGIDMDKAKQELEKTLDGIELSENIQEPTIIELDMNAMPVLVFSASSDTLDKDSLTKWANESLVDDLQSIEGVGDVIVSGAKLEEYVLTFDAKALASYNLTEDTVKQLIQANNMDMPLGIVQFADSEESVFVSGKTDSLEAIKQIALPGVKADQTRLSVKDVATIEKASDTNSISRTNGNDSISVSIIKSQSGNTVQVANEAKDALAKEKKEIKGLEIIYVLDQAVPIEESVETMLSKALFGALFAIVIIMLFLRNIRSTLISVVSIPLSLLMALAALKELGITLNIMTLGAMTVAIGRVIDDSIVVVENIYRRINDKNEQLKGKTLIKEATLEMFIPILSSTLVTIAVFLPLGLVGGMVGELFLPFALTMAFALISSLIVAITVVPVMAHSLFKKELKGEKKVHEEEGGGRLASFYEKVLTWVLNHKIITSILTMALLIGSLALLPLVGFSFIPAEEQPKQINLSYDSAPGETAKEIQKALNETESYFQNQKNITSLQATIEPQDSFMAMMGGSGVSITANFDEKTKDFEKVSEKHVKAIENLGHKGTWSVSAMSMMGGMNNSLTYDVYGNSFEDIEPVVNEIKNILNKEDGIEDVTSSLSDVYVENVLHIDKEQTDRYGLSTGQIAMQLASFEQSEKVTAIEENGKTVDIVIKREKASYETMDDVLKKPIMTPTGKPVLLKDVIVLEKGETVASVTRKEGRLFVTVSGNVKEDNVSALSQRIDKKIDKIEPPLGVEIKTAGVTADMVEAFMQLGLAMLAAIGIVYFILVVTFKEGLAPFAILFSLPLTVIGAVVGLLVTGETLSISGMLGLLMLIGIVVTNAIVLVDLILHNERKGMDIRSAIIHAGKIRLRPILMTAIATIGALIPLAIGAEGGGMISKGLGITVIGGLTSSTLLTLLIVPLVYEFLSKLFKKDRKEMDEE